MLKINDCTKIFSKNILKEVFAKYYFIVYFQNTFSKYFYFVFSKYLLSTILFWILKILLISILQVTAGRASSL